MTQETANATTEAKVEFVEKVWNDSMKVVDADGKVLSKEEAIAEIKKNDAQA
jgi:hypothetical protein